jgi:hypothetical protein
MSPQASMWVAEPSAAVPEPAARPGRRRNGGSRGEASTGPVHSTAQYPFLDVVAQRKLCGQGAASHGVVGVRAPECSPADALDGRGVESQHWQDKAVAEGSLYFPVLERQGVQELECVQPSRCRAACAEEASANAFARIRAGRIIASIL